MRERLGEGAGRDWGLNALHTHTFCLASRYVRPTSDFTQRLLLYLSHLTREIVSLPMEEKLPEAFVIANYLVIKLSSG